MSKVKQWAEDTAEKNVDLIISKVKDGQIDLDTAKTDILNVENVNMTGINADNVDEVLQENAGAIETDQYMLAFTLFVVGSGTMFISIICQEKQ